MPFSPQEMPPSHEHSRTEDLIADVMRATASLQSRLPDERRVDDILEGRVELVPARKVMEDLRAELRAMRE